METPEYYRTPAGDLYDIWLFRFGTEAVRAHLEMCAMEYLYRAGLKGQYNDDIKKVNALLERIDTLPHGRLGLGGIAVDYPLESVRAWCQAHGYGLVPSPVASPPAAPADPEATADDRPQVTMRLRAPQYANGPLPAHIYAPPPETVLQAGIRIWRERHGQDMYPADMTQLEAALHVAGYSHRLEYDLHKVELARLLPKFYPCAE